MSRDATILGACLVLALGAVIYALRCLSERLLPSAAIYTAVALGLLAFAARAAVDVF